MTRRADVSDCVNCKVGFGDTNRLMVIGQLLQHLTVDHEFLKTRTQPTFQPTGRVVNDIGPRRRAGPQRCCTFPSGLGIDAVGGVGIGGPPRQLVASCQLTRDLCGPHIFRGTKSRRTRFHVHIGGKRTVRNGGARAHHLKQCECCQALGGLLRQGPGQSDRRHRAGQRKGCNNHQLIAFGKPHGAVEHWPVMLQG